MNMQDRRSFLKISSGVLATGALGSMGLLSACKREEASVATREKPFGLQLYTLRDVLPQDPKGVLAQVASFGYKQIESYEGDSGMFWGMGNTGFKSYMDELGMKITASHVNDFNDFESFKRKADEAAAIGMEYVICPYAKRDGLEQYRALADDFNRAGEIAKEAGIRFAYHNHAYSFEKVDDVFPQDLFMQRADPDLVDFEMDIYWVVAANEDPQAWMNKYAGRFVLAHVKDMRREGEMQSTTLGRGVIDWKTLLPQARELGTKHFIVEQEEYADTSPIEATKDNAQYLSGLAF